MSNETNMPKFPDDSVPAPQALSDLMDGEAPGASAAALCRVWSERGELRADWHAFHVIGDVLRSEELGCAAQDEAFLQRLRERLSHEPAVLAPMPAAPAAATDTAPSRRGRWMAAFGVAAGLTLVASAAFVLRAPAAGEHMTTNDVARAAAASASMVVEVRGADPASEMARVANGAMVRDVQLDRYLSAHKQYSGTSALGPSAGFLRSATYETPSR